MIPEWAIVFIKLFLKIKKKKKADSELAEDLDDLFSDEGGSNNNSENVKVEVPNTENSSRPKQIDSQVSEQKRKEDENDPLDFLQRTDSYGMVARMLLKDLDKILDKEK